MNNLTKILSVVFLIVVIFFVVNYFRGANDSGSQMLASTGQTTNSTSDAKYILNLLNRMDRVQLLDGIFNNPNFIGLKDNSVALVPQPTGRENPFAPVNASEIRNATSTR